MWQGAGVVRTEEGLAQTQRALNGWLAAASSEGPRAEAGTLAEHEDRNLLTVARELVRSARQRTESRGAHHRADEPANADHTAPGAGTPRSADTVLPGGHHAVSAPTSNERTAHAASTSR